MADIVAVTRLSVCGVGVVLVSAVICAQETNGGGPGPVLGIVEIPEMFFVDPGSGQYAPRAALTLYTRPDSESKALAQITAVRQATTTEGSPGRVPGSQPRKLSRGILPPPSSLLGSSTQRP